MFSFISHRPSLLIPLIALITACGGASFSLVWSNIDHPPISGIDDFRTVVVYDAVAWQTLWIEHTATQSPQPPLPAVDFNTDMVVGVFLGARPNDCFSVRIDTVVEETSSIRVHFSELHPYPGQRCNPTTLAPAHLVTIPRSSLPVYFSRTH